MDRAALSELVASRISDVPDFPRPGVLFRDFTPLLDDPVAMRAVVDDVVARFGGRVDKVAGIEARGFMFGAASALALGVGFVPIRKAGKLPRPTVGAEYDLEYGRETIEMHADATGPGDRVLVMDDVLATGGTGAAACDLVEATGAEVVAFDVVLVIEELGGRDRLRGHEIHAILSV